MEENGLDLRAYLLVLLRHWRWIVAIPLTMVVLAVVISFFLPTRYEAVATLAVTKPRYRLQFDPRFSLTSQDPRQPFGATSLKAYSALVKNAKLEVQVIEALGDRLPPELRVPEQIEGMVDVSTSADENLIEIKVSSPDPERAALVANTWADFYVDQVDDLYGQSSGEETYISEQLSVAKADLEEAEDALVAFQEGSRIEVLRRQIQAKAQALADHLATQEKLGLVVQDASALQRQLEGGGTASQTGVNNLLALFMQVNSLSASRSDVGAPDVGDEGPSTSSQESIKMQIPAVQVQMPFTASAFAEMTREEQAQYLEHFIKSMQEKDEALEVAVQEIEPQILQLQGELQEEMVKLDRLRRERDVAEETYLALSRKADEVRIGAEGDGEVRVASPAVPPQEPAFPSLLLNAFAAGLVGLIVSIFGAFGAHYIRGLDLGSEERVRPTQEAPARPSGG